MIISFLCPAKHEQSWMPLKVMEKYDKKQVWNEVLESIKVSVSDAIYSTWISKTQLVKLKKLDEKRYLAEIGCGSSYIKSTLEQRYFGLFQDTLSAIIGKHIELQFSVKQLLASIPQNNDSPLFQQTPQKEELTEKILKAKLRLGFTFTKFAVSGSNQMANAAAEAVAQNPGSAYNPLFIWGGVGVGKTHLMHAVGHSLLIKNLNTKIVVCTGEDFTNDIVEGIRNKTTQRFRDKYRKLDALLIDDIQFIAGKDAVQDEFFHTFNAVTNAGGQIILTSDRPPTEIPRLEERLRSRFEAGLIVDIGPPDFELRCAILEIKAQEKGIEIPLDLVHLIASNLDSARKINGVLTRIISEVKLKDIALNEELVKNVIGKGDTSDEFRKKRDPDDYLEAVCSHYSVSKRQITGKIRARMVARPRQILMYLLRTELQLPLEEVGRIIGGRDHTTVMHAVDKITTLTASDVNIREDILHIKNTI